MNRFLTRRTLLQAGCAALTVPLLPLAQAQERRFAPQVGPWRSFEVTTTVNVADVKGATQLWLPVPDVDSDYQRSVSNTWSHNASTVRLASDPARGVRMLHAEFPAGTAAPTLQLTSTVQTRSRAVDWAGKQAATEDPDVLKLNLAPTDLLPLDGVVRKTALDATRGARTDVREGAGALQLGAGQRAP
jgi:hypothetical protein